jgi:pimeloyl-ACP methyl ester carboxylesterase
MTERRAELVHVALGGGEPELAGAWYAPARPSGDVAILHMHGKGGNFYTGPGRFVPLGDAAGEFAQLSLNMRCHDLGYTRYDLPMPDVKEGVVPVAGGMWERLSEAVEDVRAGIGWLQERGYPRVLVSGHSSGAYHALEACAGDGPRPAGVALLSTVISYKRHLVAWFGGEEGLAAALARAREYVAAGEGHRLIAMEAWYYGISAESLLERAALPDDAFEGMLGTCKCPILFVSGEREPRVPAWRALYDRLAAPGKRWLVLPDVGHDYGGREAELTAALTTFARDL